MKLNIIIILSLLIQLSCSFSQKIKDGEMAYERKQYAVAASMLEEEYIATKNQALKGRKAYLLGQSYLKLLEYRDARSWFEKAIGHEYGAEALGKYAESSKSIEEYESAIGAYRQLISMTGRKQELEREILLCQQAMTSKLKSSEYQIERLFTNTTVSDYSPVIYENDFLVFTSERKESTGKDIYNWTGERFADIFIVQKNGSEVKRFDSAINTSQNEGTPWFSKNMETMYFTRCFGAGAGDDFCKLMVSKRVNDIWGEPEVLPFTRDKINYGQATLVENDSILVFSADINEPGGPLDLYYTELYSDGSWSEPEPLPESINSQGNEMFPTGDGDTLYFSSDYLPGFGGFDIFKTYLRSDKKWSIPINIGFGINSGGDDFSFIVDYQAKKKTTVVQQGYFTSSRAGSGKDDIFRFFKLRQEPTPVLVETEKEKETKRELYITVRAFTPLYKISDEPNSEIVGKSPLAETFIKITDEVGQKISEAYSDKNGFYFTQAPEGKTLKIIGARLGYLNASKISDTRNILFKEGETSKTISVELILDKIYADKEINLKNIYYDYDKWDIKDEAKPTLDDLVKLLNDNPQINIQLSSHTDCRGTDEYNIVLSQKRAQSVVDYLISKNIEAQRLIAIGYGETQLIDKCVCETCSEDQHQINRRTTFKIIKK
ncbi:MAG: OmpA family protein [Saprospiraceae bacterium]|nr:OmpA family protein [Saprospiraceae bacterium]MBP6565929.1 OmpA family protein [Saprospiraceae bacterium]